MGEERGGKEEGRVSRTVGERWYEVGEVGGSPLSLSSREVVGAVRRKAQHGQHLAAFNHPPHRRLTLTLLSLPLSST